MFQSHRWTILSLALVAGMCAAPSLLHAAALQAGSDPLAARVAPGESFPLAVHLSNFGSTSRADVSILYEILDSSGIVVVSETETVAVETSASYVKQIALPADTIPGLYTARTSITYAGQKVPATASEQFTVERKIYGIFISDFEVYAAIVIAVAIFFAVLGFLLRRSWKASLFVRHDYTDIPEETRVYYEVVSDAIQQMRYHEGDRAVALAAHIPGLSIDHDSGRVRRITGDPAEVIAALVSGYQQTFGKKLNMAFTGKGGPRTIVR